MVGDNINYIEVGLLGRHNILHINIMISVILSYVILMMHNIGNIANIGEQCIQSLDSGPIPIPCPGLSSDQSPGFILIVVSVINVLGGYNLS